MVHGPPSLGAQDQRDDGDSSPSYHKKNVYAARDIIASTTDTAVKDDAAAVRGE